MPKRLALYFRERYPLFPRLFLGFLLFFEIYFLVILTNGAGTIPLHIGISEFVGAYTIFSFLLVLRIADDLKDFETDQVLFPDRPLPSGRVYKKDLAIVLAFIISTTIVLNLVFMNNLVFFLILVAYTFLMSFWFFQKHKIQPNLMLALVTHNPVQLVMNAYVISFTCFAYEIPLLTFNNFLILFTLYFPGLVWEISRKIRAPKDETDYVTYSKLFGYKKPIRFILVIMAIDMITTSILLGQLYIWAPITVVVLYAWLCWICIRFMNDPTRFKLVSRFEIYEYLAEGSVVFFIAAFLFGWWH